jgi:hypothetical protein
VVKLVDAGDSKSPAARRAGSIPALGTSISQRHALHSKPAQARCFAGFLFFGRVPPFPRSKHRDERAARRQAMSMRTMSSALCRGALAVVLALALGRCAVLTAPPVPN